LLASLDVDMPHVYFQLAPFSRQVCGKLNFAMWS
jgi:hypothetical protein